MKREKNTWTAHSKNVMLIGWKWLTSIGTKTEIEKITHTKKQKKKNIPEWRQCVFDDDHLSVERLILRYRLSLCLFSVIVMGKVHKRNQLSAFGYLTIYVSVCEHFLRLFFPIYRAKYFCTLQDWNSWNASKVRFSGFKLECGLYGFTFNTIRTIIIRIQIPIIVRTKPLVR